MAAYVGCVAGVVPVANYERDLRAAGFEAVRVANTGADLNAYAKVANQSGCCSLAATSNTGLPMAGGCGTGATGSEVHTELPDLFRRYDVNEYAASVRVYAVKAH